MTVFVLKDGTYYEPDQEKVIGWQRAYKNIDVFAEMNAASCWCDANPSKRKTKRGINRFINSWLNRAQQTNGSPQVQSRKADLEARGVKSTRDMTMEEMLSRDWAG